MKQKNLNAKPAFKFLFFSKVFFTLALFLAMASHVNAQHCEDGCTVNIEGPSYVHVGDIVTYTATPTLAPWYRQYISWDALNFLEGYGEIIDQGRYVTGEEWVTVHFIGTGWSWFTFYADYGSAHDFDEMYLQIVQ
jgi:heme/copper-type cytochrome/quinol oxidase subunit 2